MKIKRILSILLLAVMLLPLASCKKGKAKNADKTIHYHFSAEPVTLDPQVADDTPSLIAIQALFEGLTRLDSDGNASPGVAKKWEHNADSTRFTFTLRTNAVWFDKKRGNVTADDFVFAFRRALDPLTSSPTCSALYCIKNARNYHSGKSPVTSLGITAQDPHTLTVELEYSCPDFPKIAASAVCMPCCEKFFDSTAGRYGLERKYLLCNGPFTIDGAYGWDHGKQLNLRRSSRYHGEKTPLPSAVNFSIGNKAASVSDPISALQNGTVDAIEISSEQAENATEAGCTLVSFLDTTWGLCFNTQTKPFQNKKTRAAFLQAYKRENILSHIPKNCSAANYILLPNTFINGLDYRSIAGGPFYLKESPNAPKILTAGLKEQGLDKINSVTVLCPDDSNVKLMLNEMISSWNGEFNNYFNMEPLSKSDLQSHVKSGNFEAALYSITPSGDSPLSALSLFCSGADGNSAMLQDSAYDGMIADAQTKSGKDAAQIYAKAERYLNEHAIFYPLYYEKKYYAMAKGVTGIVFHPYQGGIDFISAGKE